MRNRGNAGIIALLVILIGVIFFLIVPIGGPIGLLREATISFIFRRPPRFISIEVTIDEHPKIFKAGQNIKIKGDETIVITKVNANTFFDSYMSADVEGFGKPNDLGELLDVSEIRKQLINVGVKSIPVNIYYIDHKIAKVPLEFEITEEDFARRIAKAGDIDEKIAIVKNAHTNFPRNTHFLDELDKLLSEKGDFTSLVGIYKKVVESNPDDVSSLARLSRYYIKLDLLEEALAACQEIVEKERETANTYKRMAYIAGRLSDMQNRIGYLEKALTLARGNESIILDLGRTYEDTGQRAKALHLYRSIASTTKKKEILITVIEDELKKHHYKKASAILKRYVKLFPNDKNAFAQLGMCMGRLGDTKSQILYYKKATLLSPNDPVLLYNLASSYDKAGRKKEALNTYIKVLKVKPKDKDALGRAASLSLKLKRYKEAYRFYSMLVDTSGKLSDMKGLVVSAVGMHSPDKTIDACKKYLKKKKDYEVALSMAYAYETRAFYKGRNEEARLDDLNASLKAYRLALELNSKSKEAQLKIPELKIEILKAKKGL